MRKKIYEQVYSVIQSSFDLNLGNLVAENNGFYPNQLSINGKNLVNFSQCDYLALSNDERLKKGSINAINQYGVYTAVSKTYMKVGLYEEAETLLTKIFKKPVVIFPRTTLLHIGVLPIITDSDEAIILDHQVHSSVRLAADLIKGYGNYQETIRHSRMDILEERIIELSKTYSKVWYLADGVYSMYGDKLPIEELNVLLNKYEKFHLYVDDAHGMSWTGENGKGFALSNMPHHERMVVTTSLGKGFGAGGSVVVCNDEKMHKWISTCAAPIIFTSPVCPATLGAIIEAAKIHLSNEIYPLQDSLQERIELAYKTSFDYNLPILSNMNTSIMFIATGQLEMTREICARLMEKGFFLSISQYPAVPLNNSGLRATLTLHVTKEDIINLIKAIDEIYNNSLKRRKISIHDIVKHYKIEKVRA